jgi:hypothetical protein
VAAADVSDSYDNLPSKILIAQLLSIRNEITRQTASHRAILCFTCDNSKFAETADLGSEVVDTP